MISLGLGIAILNGTALMFIKGRVPLSSRARRDAGGTRRARKIDWSFVGRKTFFVGSLVISVTGLGNSMPSLWLPCTSYSGASQYLLPQESWDLRDMIEIFLDQSATKLNPKHGANATIVGAQASEEETGCCGAGGGEEDYNSEWEAVG